MKARDVLRILEDARKPSYYRGAKQRRDGVWTGPDKAEFKNQDQQDSGARWRMQVLIDMKVPENLEGEFQKDAKRFNVKADKKEGSTYSLSTWFRSTSEEKPTALSRGSDAHHYVQALKAGQAQGTFFKTYGQYAEAVQLGTVKRAF